MIRAPITKKFISQFLPNDPVILEAGAHVGRDTVKMSTLWPEGTIFAFEPVPELFTQLVKRTKELPHVRCYNLALSDSTGTATLHVSGGASNAASSLLKPYTYTQERPNVSFGDLTVPTITLDQWAHEHDIEYIDFLWFDMQGYELKVLQAAPRILTTVKALLIEANLTERFKGNPLYKELRTWIENQGFTAIAEDIPKHNKINILFKK